MWKYTTGTDAKLPLFRDTLGAICGLGNPLIVTGSGTFVTYARISSDEKDVIEFFLGRRLWERELIL